MGWQGAAGYGNQFLCGQASGNGQHGDDEKNLPDSMARPKREVVPGSVGGDSRESAAVVAVALL